MKRLTAFFIICVLISLFMVPAFAEAAEYGATETDVGIVVDGKTLSLERQPVAIDGRILAPARSTFANLDASVEWNPKKEQVDITKGSTTIQMKIGQKRVKINDTYYVMDVPPILVRGTVMVPIRFVAETFNTGIGWDGKSKTVVIGRGAETPKTVTPKAKDGKFIVVIDPGHGGKDPGAVYKGVKEKDLNLDMAKRLDTLLKAEGIKTYMTRTDDRYVGLYDRSGLANKMNADLFISIHNNAGSSKTNGSMTLYHPSNGTAGGGLTGKDLAGIVLKEVTGKLNSKNLGTVSRPQLAVLRTTNMPSVLVEVGYMTNKSEFAKLKSADYRQKAAEALKNAILKAFKKN